MNEGYIVVSMDEKTERPSHYWDGTSLAEVIDLAFFYSEKPAARLVAGQLQAQFPEKEISTLAVKQTLVIV